MRTRPDLCTGWYLTIVLAGCIGEAPEPADDPNAATIVADEPATITPPAVSTPIDPSRPQLGGIAVDEGAEVIPQTTLHLWALLPNGQLATTYAWSVDQPLGSVSRFLPSNDIARPTFEANAAGHYTFHVTMTAPDGMKTSAAFMVAVVPDARVHVELLWHTPGDEDESDVGMIGSALMQRMAGSDVDLHVLDSLRNTHEDAMAAAPEGWFHTQFDCCWLNPDPNVHSSSRRHDPRLDRDDTDGAGPENVNMTYFEENRCHAIGVHYWDDWGFGNTRATLRVYFDGVLAGEASAELGNSDFWTVGTVCESTGEFVFGSHRVCSGTREPCNTDSDCDGRCNSDIVRNFQLPLELQRLFGP